MGAYIKRVLSYRLPERLSGSVPRFLVELLVGVAAGLAVVALRLPLVGVIGDRSPFALNFLAVVIAAVLAGWRSGAVALAASQLLTWYAIIEPAWSFEIADSHGPSAFVLATASEALILFVIALYQREVARGLAEREQRMNFLTEALSEIDHRTKNNYQTVLALVQLQMQRSRDPAIRAALQQVADRIKAVNRATEHLALRSEDLGVVRLRDHLCDLCEQVERGLSRDGVRVQCDVENLNASTEKAVYLSIIVNELVTNALKHAFEGKSEGLIQVGCRPGDGGVEILVEDNGCGIQRGAGRRSGLGTKLVQRFVTQLGGRHEVSSSPTGTVHRLIIPTLD